MTFRGYDEYVLGQRLGFEFRGQDAIKGHTYMCNMTVTGKIKYL